MKNAAAILQHAEFADIDRHFAKFIAGFGAGEWPPLVAAFLSRNIRHGHICLDLAAGPARFDEPPADFAWPPLAQLRKGLASQSAIGGPETGCPLVLDETKTRLYLRRYWEYEQSLAQAIRQRCGGGLPAHQEGNGDLQKLAVETALVRPFLVISGGPGTGKTTTVLAIIQRMLREPGGENLRIALAAPTGKAAARLQETLRAGAESAAEIGVPQTASTLHRLLGSRPGSVSFRHDAKNPLAADLVIIDEASMVPLTLMAKLFAALAPGARVILLGDRDQLSSVEPGAVLGDIAEAAADAKSPLHGSMIVLEKNHRFGSDSRIFALSQAVREGNADAAISILGSGAHADLVSAETPAPADLSQKIADRIIAGYAACLRTKDPATTLAELQRFRVLCALRSGPYGVERINRLIEEILRDAGLIEGLERAYAGRPILITRNDYPLRLFNGDIGILLPAADGTSLVAWFAGEEGSVRPIPIARLPEHEPAFAMTVHKSQGSEFENVLLLLPKNDSAVLTRELIYTGLTRARKRVEVWSDEAVLREAISRKIQRGSGLKDALMGNPP